MNMAEMKAQEDSKPKEIFISYGREQEVIAFVAKLKRDLEANGFSVWLDLKVCFKAIR